MLEGVAAVGRIVTRLFVGLVVLVLCAAPQASAEPAPVPGMDVSGHQGEVNWPAAWAAGARFAYVKATEGTGYRNPYFAQQYNGSYQVGMIRGAYHFARPDISGGPAQADFFVAHGGAWSPDGRTLPPMLDIEYNPYGPVCYGLSRDGMVEWIRSFSAQVHARTSRWPMLYTTTDWWKTCTGDSAAFGDTHPLFIARYASSPGALPSGWRYYTMWQYSDSGALPGDQDTFNGSMDQLIKLAGGDPARGAVDPAPAPPTTTTAPKTTTPTTTTTPRTTTVPTTTPVPPTTRVPTTTTVPPTTTTTAAPPHSGAASSSAWADATTRTETTATSVSAAPPGTAAVVPPSAGAEQPAEPISGLVWAGGRGGTPPASLRDGHHAEELVARVDPGAAPDSSLAPAESRALASTGTSPARGIVFGGALVLLGVILTVLARAVAPR
ncbi:lysozyme [Amycolatopsis viridis]|uniref:Lysozyme n=1 Tax=Amycolatopsis viridis TaxID=185678 RepID=A0ABX0SUE4_9PSEU|nr:lysozyme [Amycolatopsis viridis]NIH80265.1 GH25 family lysozyme M1 (1,4-beta-N-acetylmuramidase) [Amycolatopsis viridis]